MSDKISINDLKNMVWRFIEERNWIKYHDPKNLAESIVIEASELLEIFQWIEQDRALEFALQNKDKVEDEIADILIYILSLSKILDINIIDTVRRKLDVNEKRYPVDRVYGKLGR